MFNSNIPDDILRQYSSSTNDFGFSAVDSGDTQEQNPEIEEIRSKLDQILQMNATCDGALAVKNQYDALLKARLLEVERAIIPLLLNLQKNKEKDYIHWPGQARHAQCELQINKVLNLTRNNL